MNKLTTLILLLLSPLVMAQEKQVWACQQVAGTLLNWESDSWESYALNPVPILLTVDGENSTFKQGDAETSLICSGSNEFEFSCVSNPIPAFHLLIVPATGKMGVSFLYGAIGEAVEKDTISAAAFNCTKF
jgi:hypothetical protein